MDGGTDGGPDAPPPTGSNAARLADALRDHSLPFTVCYPADPVVTSTVAVTPSTITENLVAGRALTLGPGDYGAVNVMMDDIDLIAGPGVTFASLVVSGDRFRLTGGGGTTINGTLRVVPGNSDVMFDNVHARFTTAFDTFAPDELRCVAVINSSFSGTVNWAVIGGGSEDVVFARSEFVYTGPTYSPMRMAGTARLVIVGNRFYSDAQGLRIHNTSGAGDRPSSFTYVADNQFESLGNPPSAFTFVDPNNGGGDGAGLVLNDLWLLNNDYYRSAASEFLAIGQTTPGNVDTVTVTGNRGYGAATPGSTMTGINSGIRGLTASDNLNEAYVVPPAFAGGAR